MVYEDVMSDNVQEEAEEEVPLGVEVDMAPLDQVNRKLAVDIYQNKAVACQDLYIENKIAN